MDTFAVGMLAQAVTRGNERTMRKLLNDAGARLDEYRQEPGETVSRDIVVRLYAQRAGDRVGRKLAELLRAGPEAAA
ncbi:MAG: hypothetical protein QME94_14750 [Anaerolineae bacterium]|nr:hypothetical protein [Anaerolineae bacterium]